MIRIDYLPTVDPNSPLFFLQCVQTGLCVAINFKTMKFGLEQTGLIEDLSLPGLIDDLSLPLSSGIRLRRSLSLNDALDSVVSAWDELKVFVEVSYLGNFSFIFTPPPHTNLQM